MQLFCGWISHTNVATTFLSFATLSNLFVLYLIDSYTVSVCYDWRVCFIYCGVFSIPLCGSFSTVDTDDAAERSRRHWSRRRRCFVGWHRKLYWLGSQGACESATENTLVGQSAEFFHIHRIRRELPLLRVVVRSKHKHSSFVTVSSLQLNCDEC